MISTKIAHLIILLSVSLISCEKTLINFTANPDKETTEEYTDSSQIRLLFDAKIGQFKTKTTGSAPIQTSRYINIYLFSAVNTKYMNSYVSKTAGTLTPLDSALFVPVGSYNMYAVGINRAATGVPVFSAEGYSTNLAYNQDYIWWATYNQTPVYPVTNYEIEFRHCFTQVVFDLNIPDDITINNIESFSITPSVIDTVSWSLYYGNIGPVSGFSSDTLSMNYSSSAKNSYVTQAMMPPVKVSSTTYMDYNFRIKINNEIAARIYQTKIPVYQNEFKAGYTYKYNLNMQVDTVTIADVNIVNWIDIDGSSKPILPTESE